MKNITSQAISFLRFPLILSVVLLHTYITGRSIGGKIYVEEGMFPFFDFVEFILRSEIANVSVPLFFFISGYLFYNGFSSFQWKIVKMKLGKRIHSLFIPYIFWNTLFLLFIVLIHEIAPTLLSDKQSIGDMSCIEIIDCFWSLNQGLIPLWFIRDLMIINLLSPIIYFVLHQRYSKFILLLFFILFLSTLFHYLPGIGLRALFPYMFGAYFSINGKDLISSLRSKQKMIIAIAGGGIIIDTILWTQGIFIFSINRFSQTFLMLSILLFAAWGIERKHVKINKLYTKSAFFVFAFHMFIVYIPSKLWVYILPVNTLTATLALLCIPLLVGYTCVGVYAFSNRYFPKITTIATGQRSE